MRKSRLTIKMASWRADYARESDEEESSEYEEQRYHMQVVHENCCTSDDAIDEEVHSKENILVQPKKRGRKAQWIEDHVADMVDVICSDDYFSRKLIFTNSKNTKNNQVYDKVQQEIKKRYTGSSTFPYTTAQMRTKFKRCVAECKKLALTLKTATGVKRFQEERGYGQWFQQLFTLVKSRDSCNPELAEEPSSSRSGSSLNTETGPEDEGKKLFVPKKRSKESKNKEDVLISVVEVLKDISQQDTTANLRKFFQEENQRAREHEMRLFQLFMSGTGSQASSHCFTAQSQGVSSSNRPGPNHMYHQLQQPVGSVIAGTERAPTYNHHASSEMYQQSMGNGEGTFPSLPTYYNL